MPMFNFLLKRQNPIFYDIFFPHTIGGLDKQKQIIRDFKNLIPRYLIVTIGFVDFSEASLAERRFRVYGKTLYNYLLNHYDMVFQSGPFIIMESNILSKQQF